MLVACLPAQGSDHADPIKLKRLEAGITGLFAFPNEDKLVVILGVRRALTESPPFDLKPYTYRIHMDLDTAVSFENKEDQNRYGGTVLKPEKIHSKVTIEIRLNDDTTVREKTFAGLNNPDSIRLWTGIRDDPFIFPRFFGTNIVAMVMEIPFTSFPENQQDFILWATSSRKGRQIDHVGRANRTMLPRFDFLNKLPPSEHVAALHKRHDDPGLVQDIARTEIMPLFALRQYDFAPDVMIFTRRFPAKFPNGRLLTDDVAALTCQQGDCLLWELSFADSDDYPRKEVNDKPFLDAFPYLAEPWPTKPVSPTPGLTGKNKTKLVLIILLVVVLFLLPWILYWKCRRNLKSATA